MANIGDKIKDGLYTYSKDIQDAINKALLNMGVIKNQVSPVVISEKEKTLQDKADETKRTYLKYAGYGLLGIGSLWILSMALKNKK